MKVYFSYRGQCIHPDLFILLATSILIIILSACQPAGPSSSEIQESEALLTWMKNRVTLMVDHKASCEGMARALLEDHRKHQEQLKGWRSSGTAQVLMARAQRDEAFARELNGLIIKGDLVHSYCAYQESFRDQLRLGLTL